MNQPAVDVALRLRANLPTIQAEVEEKIAGLVQAQAIDEAHGAICDPLIDAWLFSARKQLDANFAELKADLDAQALAARQAVDHSAADLRAAEDAVEAAKARIADFYARMERERNRR